MRQTKETIEAARKRVKGAVSGMTTAQVEAIAKHHHETGDSVWHSVHIVLKTKKCHCVPCNQ